MTRSRRCQLRGAIGVLVCAACARSQLSLSDLQQVTRPAFLGRIEENAGPAARVFREDVTYREKLNRLDPKEADRRLQLKLARSVTRFEVSDRLRAVAFSQLPKERPWSNTVDPAAVAGALESFLVEHVPANPPDYDLLKTLGADAVVEFVVEEYGLRSEKGHSGAYAVGYARLFLIDGATLWHRSFKIDHAADQALPSLDPFEVAKEPERFRVELSAILDQVGLQLAKDLSPGDRSWHPELPASESLQPTPPASETPK